MSEKQLLKSLLEVCYSSFPLLQRAKRTMGALLQGVRAIFFRKKSNTQHAKTEDLSSSTESDIHRLPKGVSLPVIFSHEPNANSGSAEVSGLNDRLQVGTYVASKLIEKCRGMKVTSFWGQICHVCYSYLLRNEINKSGIVDLILSTVIGQARSKSLLDSIKADKIPACPVSAASLQSCVHAMEGLTILMGLDLQNNKYSAVSSHIASSVTSLLGLQLALKSHRDAYRKYNMKISGVQSGVKGSNRGGKEYFSQNEGSAVVAQTPWVTADTQALSMSLDDAFSRMMSKYGDIIPSYSFPTAYLEELKHRLAECGY